MKQIVFLFIIVLFIIGGVFRNQITGFLHPTGGAPPYDSAFDDTVDMDRFAWLDSWKRPDGPVKVALQVGHWKNEQLPEELKSLRGSTGASGGGKSEWEVNLSIAEKTKTLLEAQGVLVDILPATVPIQYWADAFVAIHADGNTNTGVSGFKVAAPRRDRTGKAEMLAAHIIEHYQEHTDIEQDPNITRNMRGYYAFAWWRRDHAVHPMTPSVIVETGFLTSPRDRRTLVDNPDRSAQGIARGILAFLTEEKLL